MISLKANERKTFGRKTDKIRQEGIIPAVLYGPKVKSISLEVNLKDFEKVYKEVGESSLITLELEKKKYMVLIHAVETGAMSQNIIHVDFYQPNLDEEITATISLLFEGEAPAVKNLSGTLVKNIHSVEVRALPQNLIHEIKVDLSKLETFEDNILIKDLQIPNEIKIMKDPMEIIALVVPAEKIEEELEKPIEEKVEEVGTSKEKPVVEEEPEENKK